MARVDLCYFCGCKLKTNKERAQDFCEDCWEQYVEEMEAKHGDGWNGIDE